MCLLCNSVCYYVTRYINSQFCNLLDILTSLAIFDFMYKREDIFDLMHRQRALYVIDIIIEGSIFDLITAGANYLT